MEKAEPRSAASAGRAVLLFLCVLTLLRLVYAARLGLAEDEAYYWQWSRHPDLSYYDQGPLIAWVIRAGTLLLGHTPLGVRLFVVLPAGLTGWLIFLTARAWLGERAAVWAVGLTSIAPLFAVGSVLATYDAPQVFLWTLALYAFTRTIQENQTSGWYVVGLLVGLGTLAKLPMLGFAPSVLLFLLLSPANRRWLATPHPYLAFVFALAVCAPPLLIWNARHDWLGFLHLFAVGNRTGVTGHAAITTANRLRWFGDFWGGQVIALSPLLFFAEIAALLRRRGRDDKGDDAHCFLFAFTVPLLAVCLVIALRSRQEINWPVSAHVSGLMAVAAVFARTWDGGRAASRAGVAFAVLLALAMTTIVIFPQVLPTVGLRVSADAAQKLNQTYGWPEVAARVQAVRRALEAEGRPVFVAGVSYRVNSVLAFYLPDQPEVRGLYPGTRRDQYFLWTDPARLVGQNAVVCLETNDPAIEARAARVRRWFGAVMEAGPPIVMTRPGFVGPVRIWRVFACRDFRGYDPNETAEGF